MRIGILGPLEVSSGNERVEIHGPKQRALLAFLTVNANRVVSVDKIVDALWGQEANDRAVETLRVHVAKLRKALERDREHEPKVLLTRRPGYMLRLNPEALDANRFEELVKDGRRALADDPRLASSLLTSAFDLWRGPPLDDVAYEAFAQTEIQRLEELRLSATEALFDSRLATGEDWELIGELEALVAAHPLRERLWAHLMLALYRCDRQADALKAYRRLSDILGLEGLVPGPETERLEERILLSDPALLTPIVEPGAHRRPPAERTRLIGRSREIEELHTHMSSTRLLTLTGTGGVGKTRLAQRLGWSMIEEGTEVWWVELSMLGDPQLLSEQILAAGGRPQGGNVETVQVLVSLLRTREMVIVLDNCEHLIDATARLVDHLLDAAPGVRFVVTTREPLHVDGERVWRVPSLPVPDIAASDEELAGNPSVEMFLERSRARGTEIGMFAIEAAAICRRLDGIPLALELAAARTTTLSMEEINAGLADRFSLLERRGRIARSRHRTMEAAIDWSFRLLDPVDRRLLSRLAVFAGGFDRSAVRQVCAFGLLTEDDVEVSLERLIDKSMVEASAHGAGRRFQLTESVQAFAWDRLIDDPDELLDRHRGWALGFAIEGGKAILTDQNRWLASLEATHEDFRAAFNESLERGDAETALRLVGALSGYFLLRRTNEALRWLERAVSAAEASPDAIRPATMALGLVAIGPFLCFHERLAEGHSRLEEAGRLYAELDNPAGLMWVRYQQSYFPASGEKEESVRHARSALELARQSPDPVRMAHALVRLAEARLNRQIDWNEVEAGTWETVLELCDEAASYCEKLPDSDIAAVLKVVQGTARVAAGRQEALALVEEGMEERARYGLGVTCAAQFISVGQVARRVGSRDRSRVWTRRGLRIFRDLGLPCTARVGLVGAAAELERDHPAVAAHLLEAAVPLQPSYLYGTTTFEDEEHVFTRLRSSLGSGERWEEANGLDVRAAIDLALAHLF